MPTNSPAGDHASTLVNGRLVGKGEQASEASQDPRSARRAARTAENRRDILDAAERVFGEYGIRDGSLRQIAQQSGFSTAAIYLFFENKQHLLSETLARRGVELINTLRSVAHDEITPLAKLHRIVDVTIAFFEGRPAFRQLLRQATASTAIVGPTLGAYAGSADGDFVTAMNLIADVVSEGQQEGELRDGDPHAIAHLYSVLINEYVLLNTETEMSGGTLTSEQFHSLIDGALRRPTTAD
jgi:AcrR family transcriptional regulator